MTLTVRCMPGVWRDPAAVHDMILREIDRGCDATRAAARVALQNYWWVTVEMIGAEDYEVTFALKRRPEPRSYTAPIASRFARRS